MSKGIIILLSILYSVQLHAQDTLLEKKIQLEAFSSFPNEIDGCSCYFSISQEKLKKEEYIFVGLIDKSNDKKYSISLIFNIFALFIRNG